MSNEYQNLLNSLRGDLEGAEEMAYDVGDDDLGYDVGDDEVGADFVGYDEMGNELYEVGASRPRRLARPRRTFRRAPPPRRVIRRPPPPPPGRSAGPADRFDKILSGAMREAGQNVAAIPILSIQQTVSNGDVINVTVPAPCACVLMTLSPNDIAIAGFRNCDLKVGGIPAAGLVNFTLARFVPQSTFSRIPPVEISSGQPVTFSAVVGGLANPNLFASLEVIVAPIHLAAAMASRY